MKTIDKQSNSFNEPTLITIKYNGYSHIVFNRPKDLNALTTDCNRDLIASLKNCEADENTNFIILSGSGRAFCAGADIKDVIGVVEEGDRGKTIYETIVRTFYETLYYIGCVMKTPIISFMDGITFGGGIGISQLSAFKIATENTIVCFPETLIGHFCDAGASFTIPRMEDYLGVYLGLTGHRVYGEDVLLAGFATHFMSSENFQALEKKLSEQDKITLDIIDDLIQEFSVPLNHIPSKFTLDDKKVSTIKRCFKYDKVQDIITALEREDSEFSKSCLKSMRNCSPTSLKVTMETIQRGTKSSIAECFNYEYCIWSSLPYSHDYQEGVRSFIEKRQPKWAPSTLDELDDKLYFQADNPLRNFLNLDLKHDYSTSPYKRFHLPTVKEVMDVKQKYNLKASKEIVAWFSNKHKGKFGIEQKVSSVLYEESASESAKL